MSRAEFRTYDELIAIMNGRGIATDENTLLALMAESYYSIINGYKTPFIDKFETNRAGDDRYKKDVQFQEIYSLFCFDRELRNLVFGYIIQAEVVIKNLLIHSYCEKYPQPNSFTERANYTSYEDWLLRSDNETGSRQKCSKELGKLIKTLVDKSMVSRTRKDFIAHYRDEYGFVPL